MRVMHVVTGLRAGGAENQIPLLARHSASETTVVALTNPDEVADRLRADGVRVLHVGMRSNRDVAAVARLARIVRAERPDVVHLHLFRAMLYGRVAARLAGLRRTAKAVVTTEHSLLEGQTEGRRTSRLVRGLYLATEPWNDLTVAVSEEVADRLVRWGVAPAKVVVVPNAVDVPALQPAAGDRDRVRAEWGVPETAQVIAGVGRLHPVKRWDLLVRALAPVLGPERRLVLVGEGEERDSLERLAAHLGVTQWVHLTGTRSDLAAVLAATDVVVSCSPQETFGLAVVEARLAERRVVYVHSPGLQEAGAIDGAVRVTGDEKGLRAAVMDALSRPERPAPAHALGRYDVRTVARQLDDLYASVVGRAAASRDRAGSAYDGGNWGGGR